MTDAADIAPTRPPIAVTLGEPGGIGPDLILMLHAARAALGLPDMVVYGAPGLLEARARRLGLSMEVAAVDAPASAMGLAERALPVITTGAEPEDRPGEIVPDTASLVVEAIARATADVRAGAARALVTAPIHKSALTRAGFSHPGHTEFLAALCAGDGVTPLPVMMLAHEGFRVVPLTIHEPLARVPALITRTRITETIRVMMADLTTRFGVAAPRIAVTGLNPHAGEDGTIGTEERDVIGPALDALRGEGLRIDGPLPADTLFHPPHWLAYDVVLAMYHDQALIPIKTVAFESGVNVTLGLPIIRTSPDHGTALTLAGTGRASVASMLAALMLADRLS